MRPLLLTMSAFGSYGGQEQVDFEKIGRGIFLITGDTGAGKTTIFDGMIFCLYDITSGGRRDGEMMRSHYASDDTPTFVELTFEEGKERYTVRRNPAYQRRSRRKNKDGEYVLTTESASVELTMPDGSLYKGRMKEVNRKIVEILGMDANQFLQIGMIAQGDFLRLLHAPSKERKEIFGKIFNTRIYGRIQNELKNTARELEQGLAENERECLRELSSAEAVRGSAFEEQLSALLKGQEAWGDEALEILAHVQEELLKSLQELKEERRKLKEKIEKKEQYLQLEKRLDEGRQRVNGLKTWLLNQKELLKSRDAALKEAKGLQEKESPGLDADIVRLKDILPGYRELEESKKNLAAAEKNLERWEKSLAQAEKSLAEKKAQAERLEKEQEKLEGAGSEIPRLAGEIQELKNKEEAIRGIGTLQVKIEKLADSLKKRKDVVNQCLGEYSGKAAAYNGLYTRFIEEQVGMIARGLKEGAACPVCGSREHPHPAKPADIVITQQMVEAAREEAGNLEKRLNEEKEEFLKEKQMYQVENEHLTRESEKWFGKALTWKKEAQEERRNAEEKCREQWYSLSLQREQKEKEKRRFEENKERIKALSKEQESLTAQAEELRKAGEELRLHLQMERKELETQKSRLPYPEKSMAEGALNTKLQRKNKLLKDVETAQKALDTGLEEFNRRKGALLTEQEGVERMKKELEKSALDGIPEEEIGSLKTREALLEDRERELDHQRRKNEQGRNALEKLFEERLRLKTQYGMVGRLDKTANGKLLKTAGVDFQTYVQRRYFSGIIQEANKRLLKMTGGKFLLKCRDMKDLGLQGEVGLDLDVYSCVTDSIRDVKTLSGGESFMSALAMALGMADIVQRTAGKIRLDAMFIDEGFGSLDEESRQQAIRVLNELTGENRLVGIISHVEELKEQIDRKLVIRKDKNGSRIELQTSS